MNSLLMKILEDKEERYNKQEELIQKHKATLVCFMLNIVGDVKVNQKYINFHRQNIKALKQLLNENDMPIIYEEYFVQSTAIFYMACLNAKAKEVKSLAISLEETSLGRILDIDVYDNLHKAISRKALNLPARKCMLCNLSAQHCIVKRNHSLEELLKYTNDIIDEYNKNS